MPTERPSLSPVVEQPKLEVVRLEDRLNPVGLPTAESFLSFTPNAVLDTGTSIPSIPLGSDSVSAPATAPATIAPADLTPIPNSYELVLPVESTPSTTAAIDTSGGAFALFSVVPPPPVASISGFVYVDEGAGGGTRDDGLKTPGEPGIPGSSIELLRVINGVTLTVGNTLTDATGFYQFTSLSPFGEYVVRQTAQPAGFLDGKDTPGSEGGVAGNEIISGITLSASANGVNYNFGELLPPPPPGALSGFVYVDEGANGGVRDDGVKQAGEPGIAGVPVALFRVVNGVTTSLSQTTTDGSGFYQFTDLAPGGGYLVRELTQPVGFLDGKDTAGTTGGSNAINEELSGVTVPAGSVSQNNNFGELLPPPPPGALSGFVYVDEGASGGTRDDGIKQAGEPGIPGTSVTLFRVVNGVTSSIGTTVTDATGFYQFTNLTPGGGYLVRETQPVNFLDGKDTAGTTGGSNAVNDDLSGITVPAGGVSQNNNFGELLPPPAQFSGFVYEDDDNDGVKDAGEAGIPGTLVTLTDGTVTLTTTTDLTGFYQFTNLTPGTYRANESQPANYLDGKDTAGTRGGTVTNDQIAAVVLNPGDNSQFNNFGELKPARLSGFEYEDLDDDGVKDPSELGIPGVAVVLTGTDDLGAVTRTAITGSNGGYEFTALRPGTYTVSAAQPPNYNDGKDTPGSTGGSNAVNDVLSGIPLVAGANSVSNNFGELIPPGTLSGFVYVDEGDGGGTRDDGIKTPGEPGIPGTVVTLFRVQGGVTTSLAQTTTDATGFYQFTGLQPGSGYMVRETQPATFLDGKDTPGTTGGTNSANDELSGITIPPGGTSQNNNFGELLQPGSLSGFVYEDPNDNGLKEAGEAGIPGTTVTLFRVVNGVTTSLAQTTTDATGFYQFTGLVPGSGYRVVEAQPAAYADGKDTPGSTGGTNTVNDQLDGIAVPAGGVSVNNNFGERLGQISGFVYVDEGANGGVRDDGVKQAGEPGILGTTVTLLRVDNGVTTTVGTTVTDATGFYQFTRLAPGTYAVRETQPAGFDDGKDTPGAGNGGTTPSNDLIATIGIGGAFDLDSPNNNFGELLPPPPPGAISGFVYQDPNNNGVKETGEAPIPGTTVTLFRVVNGVTTSLAQTVTDAAGFYRFTNLTPGGGYLVRETQPAGFNDGKDTPGSTGGSNAVNDQLSGVTVPAGGESVNNNFGELLPQVIPGALSGYVYEDNNDNAVREAGEAAIAGVVVTLYSQNAAGGLTPVATTTTNGAGFYQFLNLTPGAYTVVEAQPVHYIDGQEAVGSTGGVLPSNDVIGSVTVPAGVESVNNNFGELKCVSLYGFVWYDANENGRFDPSEIGLPGATVTITGTTQSGRPLTTALSMGNPLVVTTDANGRYAYPCLPIGTYTVVQTNTPAGYTDFKEENAAGLTLASSTNTVFAGVALNRDAGPLNFGKVLSSIVVPPPPPNPQFPLTSKQDFLGSSGATVAVLPPAPGQQLPSENLQFNPTSAALQGAPRLYAVGAGAGAAPMVRVFDAATGSERFRIMAFAASFTGGVSTAIGDVSGDGIDDVIVAASIGGGPHVKAFDGNTGAEIRSFYAYSADFRGGVWVASGDVDGDGFDDIVTGAGAGGGPHVKVFSGKTGAELRSFYAFDQGVTSGVRVAAGDFNGDGIDDIAAATGAGVVPQVTTFDGRSLAQLGRFAAYEPGFLGGVFLASGDVNGDGLAEVVVGAGNGGGPRVRVLNATSGAAVYDFFADTATTNGGVRVAAADLNGDGKADIITGGGVGQLARVQAFSGAGLGKLDDFFAFESSIKTGIYVG